MALSLIVHQLSISIAYILSGPGLYSSGVFGRYNVDSYLFIRVSLFVGVFIYRLSSQMEYLVHSTSSLSSAGICRIIFDVNPLQQLTSLGLGLECIDGVLGVVLCC